MTRKRSEDNDIINMDDVKKRVRILYLTEKYLKERRKLESESVEE